MTSDSPNPARASAAPTAKDRPGPLACDYEGWNLHRLNAEAEQLRVIHNEEGIGAMLAHATSVPHAEWVATGGIDRPAGK
jgi:hypothetical protein